MKLKGLNMTGYLKRIGISQDSNIPQHIQQLKDEFMIKPRINKEMPTVKISSTPHRITRRDIVDVQVLALENYYNSVYDEIDTYPSLEYKLANAKPKERRKIRRKMRKRNKLNKQLNRHKRQIIIDDFIGIENNTGRKYAVQVCKVNKYGSKN